jgi:hypothetical protein
METFAPSEEKMNAPPGPLNSKDVKTAFREIRAERALPRVRDRLMPRVRAARKRFRSKAAA